MYRVTLRVTIVVWLYILFFDLACSDLCSIMLGQVNITLQ